MSDDIKAYADLHQIPADVLICCLHRALHGYERSGERWAALRTSGADDATLAEAIGREFGHGSSNYPAWHDYQGGKNPQIRLGLLSERNKPLKGDALLSAARDLLGIEAPGTTRNLFGN